MLAGLISSAISVLPSQAAEAELIVNGGFEDGTNGWFVNDGNPTDHGTLSTTPDAFSGQAAALITQRATTGSGPIQVLSGKVAAGETYRLSAKIRYDAADAPASKQFFATMHYGGGTYTNLVSVTATKGSGQLSRGTSRSRRRRTSRPRGCSSRRPGRATRGRSRDASHGLHGRRRVGDRRCPPAPPSKTIEVLGKIPGDHNPVISHKFGADAFGFVDDGRVYLYMTNDTQGTPRARPPGSPADQLREHQPDHADLF
ncbi:carbohydrate binding domain-containing protein [Oerskovia sp. M15]